MDTTRSATRPREGWAIVNLATELWRRFRDAARAMPRRAWASWSRVIVAGLVVTCLVALGLTLWARWAEPRGLAAWDERALASIIERAPITFAQAIVFESPGNMVGIGLLMGATLFISISAGRPLVPSNMLVGYGLGAAAFWVGWSLWDRARPEVVAGGIAAPGLHSFPSGHMVHVTLLYGYLTFLWYRSTRSPFERAIAVLLCAGWVALVGTARLVLGTHWPSDILAGALLGLLLAVTLAIAHTAAEHEVEQAPRAARQS